MLSHQITHKKPWQELPKLISKTTGKSCQGNVTTLILVSFTVFSDNIWIGFIRKESEERIEFCNKVCKIEFEIIPLFREDECIQYKLYSKETFQMSVKIKRYKLGQTL